RRPAGAVYAPANPCSETLSAAVYLTGELTDVLGPLDKAQSGQFLDLGTWRTAGKGEVIILDGLDRGQRGNLHQGSPLAFDPGVVLDAQQAFQEVTMAGVLAGTLLSDGRPLAA